MNTPQTMTKFSARCCGIMPAAVLSATARATAAWAGPNICTACFAPLIVTLLNKIVSGFAARLGATTASSVVKPSLLFVSALQNAAPAGPVLEPMTRSMCATSLPSPTSDSPMKKSAIGEAPVRKKCEVRHCMLTARSASRPIAYGWQDPIPMVVFGHFAIHKDVDLQIVGDVSKKDKNCQISR